MCGASTTGSHSSRRRSAPRTGQSRQTSRPPSCVQISCRRIAVRRANKSGRDSVPAGRHLDRLADQHPPAGQPGGGEEVGLGQPVGVVDHEHVERGMGRDERVGGNASDGPATTWTDPPASWTSSLRPAADLVGPPAGKFQLPAGGGQPPRRSRSGPPGRPRPAEAGRPVPPRGRRRPGSRGPGSAARASVRSCRRATSASRNRARSAAYSSSASRRSTTSFSRGRRFRRSRRRRRPGRPRPGRQPVGQAPSAFACQKVRLYHRPASSASALGLSSWTMASAARRRCVGLARTATTSAAGPSRAAARRAWAAGCRAAAGCGTGPARRPHRPPAGRRRRCRPDRRPGRPARRRGRPAARRRRPIPARSLPTVRPSEPVPRQRPAIPPTGDSRVRERPTRDDPERGPPRPGATGRRPRPAPTGGRRRSRRVTEQAVEGGRLGERRRTSRPGRRPGGRPRRRPATCPSRSAPGGRTGRGRPGPGDGVPLVGVEGRVVAGDRLARSGAGGSRPPSACWTPGRTGSAGGGAAAGTCSASRKPWRAARSRADCWSCGDKAGKVSSQDGRAAARRRRGGPGRHPPGRALRSGSSRSLGMQSQVVGGRRDRPGNPRTLPPDPKSGSGGRADCAPPGESAGAGRWQSIDVFPVTIYRTPLPGPGQREFSQPSADVKVL